MSFPFEPFLPRQINTGPWVGGYSLDALRSRVQGVRVVLPICSFGARADELGALGQLVLPPLYHEAFRDDAALKADMIEQIRRCFPFFEGTRARSAFKGEVAVVELPQTKSPPPTAPRILGIGVDTTIEQHGPHLPLATDTIQTYAVLQRVAQEVEGFVVGPALEYGHLTWGLPFGMSVDLTPPVLARYALGFINALVDWLSPEAIYVADVHGSAVHRQTIQDALRRSRARRGAFRWVHDPLVEFSAERGDMHAGGVETTLVAHINPALVDDTLWPARMDELVRGEMQVSEAIELSNAMPRFIARVEGGQPNGIIGNIRNGLTLDAVEMMQRMVRVALEDVARLSRES